jgi:hypothetical protein
MMMINWQEQEIFLFFNWNTSSIHALGAGIVFRGKAAGP